MGPDPMPLQFRTLYPDQSVVKLSMYFEQTQPLTPLTDHMLDQNV
jgi:hypothetical protein